MIRYPVAVLPQVGCSFAKFGEFRSQHRGSLGEFESWKRNLQKDHETDLYVPSLVSLDYDGDDRLTFIEVMNDRAEVLFQGVPLLNQPTEKVLSAMSALGHEAVGPVVGIYAYPELGIRLGEDFDDEISDGYAIKTVGLSPEETDPDLRRT